MSLKFVILYIIYTLVTIAGIFVIYKLAEYKKIKSELTEGKKYFITQGLIIQVVILLMLYAIAHFITTDFLSKELFRYIFVLIYFVILDIFLDYLLENSKKKEIFSYLELSLFVIYGIITALTFTVFLVKL